MAAQLCPAAGITGVEIDSAAASAAGANFQASPWASRLEVVNADINTFGSTGAYQLIVSNPPYYSNGAVSTDDSRAGARHQNSLTFGNLLEAVGRLIAADGCFAMVTPPDAEADILLRQSSRDCICAVCAVWPLRLHARAAGCCGSFPVPLRDVFRSRPYCCAMPRVNLRGNTVPW